MFKSRRNIGNRWFFTDLPTWCKIFLFVFVKGDLLILLPVLFVILLVGFFSLKLMLILLGSYIAVRYLGEMMYWLLQQFGDRTYRPADFGLKNLDNHAIYVLYQTIAIAGTVIGIGLATYAALYLK